jgi:hypothetical protein
MGLRDLFKRPADDGNDDGDARPRRPAKKKEPCPRCDAPPEKRTEACGFGPVRPIVCGVCGYEFKE